MRIWPTVSRGSGSGSSRPAQSVSRILVAMTLLVGMTVAYAAPAGAAPSWKVVSSANPTSAPNAQLNDIACPGATSCFAVGGVITAASGFEPLAEHWDGAHWSNMSVPAVGGLFQSIACPSPTVCVAVGGAGSSMRAAAWNGTTWTIEPLADPGTGPAAFIASVACSSTTNCFAVGSKGSATLIESWDGATWSIAASADVASAADGLGGVSCASASSCVAVGTASVGDVPQTLVESWDGANWTIVPSPTPAGSDLNLKDVSCASATSCVAVGWVVPAAGPESPFVESWDGANWSLVSSPTVSATDSSFLLRVDCSSAVNCFATGDVIANAGGASSGLVEHWDGTSWSINSSQTVDPTHSNVAAVACLSDASCFGIGATLFEHWNGASWSTSTSPALPGPSNATLASVACVSATKCFGVGQDTNAAGGTVTLIESRVGTKWSVVASPNAPGTSMLSSVACPSATSCFAVGRSGSGGAWRTLIERWNGKAWSIMSSPNVSRLAHHQVTPNSLLGVACSSATNCFAVGYSIANSSNTLIEHWDGKKWTIVLSPNKSKLKTAESVLESVSCASATSCLAVGRSAINSSNQASTYRTLTERWNGKAWRIVSSPNTVTGSGELLGVSCASATACVAVGGNNTLFGESINPIFSGRTLILTWTGNGWKRVTSSDPVGAPQSTLRAVSCTSSKSCVAVGNIAGPSIPGTPLVKTLAGGQWSNGSAASPAGATNISLNGVSCRSGAGCTAVGTFAKNGAPRTLVERYS